MSVLSWIVKAGKGVLIAFKAVTKWAYNHPVVAVLVGAATYALTQWVRHKAQATGYIPVVTEIGAVASYASTVFQYAIATGLALATIGDAAKETWTWLAETRGVVNQGEREVLREWGTLLFGK